MQVHPPTERSFGLGVGTVSALVGAVLWWRGSPAVGPVLGVLGAALVILAAIAPAALRVPNRVWWRFAQALGWVNTRVLLTLFFGVVLTPVGGAMRLFGRNPLRGPVGPTNWGPYPARHANPKHYEHLY